ncbi:MAG: arsenate reductase ArsC [Bacteroidales bacterium]|jgi:arsenate reductase|nr:arsenate reductase ArsC [Bacteroidales bacterium]
MKTKILILCTGNSCRSQMAHGFLQSFDKRLEVKSGGTKPANRVNPTAVEVMSELDIDISHHVPQNVDNYKGQEWDYVITVCDNAKENCPVFSGKVKHRLHIGFEDPSEAVGTPDFIMSEYHRIRDEIRSRFHELYTEKILPELN